MICLREGFRLFVICPASLRPFDRVRQCRGRKIELILAQSHARGTSSARTHSAIDIQVLDVTFDLDCCHVVPGRRDISTYARCANDPARLHTECNRGKFDKYSLYEAFSGSTFRGQVSSYLQFRKRSTHLNTDRTIAYVAIDSNVALSSEPS